MIRSLFLAALCGLCAPLAARSADASGLWTSAELAGAAVPVPDTVDLLDPTAQGRKAQGKRAQGKKAQGKKAQGKKAQGKKAQGKRAQGKAGKRAGGKQRKAQKKGGAKQGRGKAGTARAKRKAKAALGKAAGGKGKKGKKSKAALSKAAGGKGKKRKGQKGKQGKQTVKPAVRQTAAAGLRTTPPSQPANAGKTFTNKRKRYGFSGREHCSAMSSATPSRVAAGQAGVCTLVLSLKQNAVLLPETEFKVKYDKKQGPIRLSKWRRPPPSRGTLHERFERRPVYDNTVLVKIPFTVAAGTEKGSYPINGVVRTEVHDGDTGEKLGTYADAVFCQVEVGRAIPTPVVRLRPRGESASKSSHGFVLTGVDTVEVPAGSKRSFDVVLKIPDGVSVPRQEKKGLPSLRVYGSDEGVRFSVGPEAAPIERRGREVYQSEYRRALTVLVAPDAPLGRREAEVTLRYLSRNEERVYPLDELVLDLVVEVLPPERAEGQLVAGADEPYEDAGEEGVFDDDAWQDSGSDTWLFLLLGGGALGLIGLLIHHARSRAAG